MNKRMGWFLAAMLVVGLCAGRAQASVMQLMNMQAQQSSLIHHWTFEGEDDAERREDKEGSLNMVVWNRDWTLNPNTGNPGSAEDPEQTFVPGFDWSTTASRSFSDGGDNTSKGSALRANADITMPLQGTLEFMVYHDGALLNGCAFGGAAMPDNRWLFGQGINLRIGPNVVTGALFPNMKADQWYYAAVTWEIDTEPDEEENYPVTLNGWYADLSGDAPFALVQSITNVEAWVNDYEAGIRMGIGAASGTSSFLDGMTDAVAMYNQILSVQTLESHVSAIPEPGTFVLLTGALGSLFFFLRRRRP